MIPRRLPTRRLLLSPSSLSLLPRISLIQSRCLTEAANDPNITDPGMNGGYVNPPPMKRALRDPYGNWWDPQERRNFGEPLHEDNDTLAVFSTEPYTHSKPGKAFFHLSIFVAAIFGLASVVGQFYPDRPSAPRTWEDGMEQSLGGPDTKLAPRTIEEGMAKDQKPQP